jgi:diguanylate cyclase (GGDEF)-like protein
MTDLLSVRKRGHGFALRVVEHLSVPTFVLAADHRVLVWNNACEQLTGAPAREVLGTRDHWRAFYNNPRPCLADLVLEQRFGEIESLYVCGAGSARRAGAVAAETWCEMPRLGRPLYLAIDAAPIYDRSSAVMGAVETLRDVTRERERQVELESLAALDGLTGLFNRRSFDKRLSEEVRRALRVRHPLALLMIDVDDFKPYNDAHGHQIGDACLRRVALAIRGALSRAGDLAARYGGDEFAVILPDTDRIGALRVAQRIRDRVDDLGIANPFSSTSQRLTLSIGGSYATGEFEESAERLVASADAELYRAKRSGRDRISVSDCVWPPKALDGECAARLDPIASRP